MATIKRRPDPVIPDHEVLRKVGGGAYGEVWLARGVTGALRAVKVLWREDFEDERGFEREFEGILKFEPISRDHPGMVNILHVGRSVDGKSFYYYVMELGDDVLTGREINPVEYEARTLRSDTQRAAGKRLDTDFCIDAGLRLAEALRHLHDHGLAHRDVKPANIIFVAGRAKLADIGLVAARGQRTFVGTEGFVPPEGPGSAQADVYSLGKVLYEIATGKDRMEFPELPDELPSGAERKRWLALNQIICDACEPQLSKRRISSAGELADALRRLQDGKRRRRRRPLGSLLATGFIAVVTGFAAWEAFREGSWAPFGAGWIDGNANRVPAPVKGLIKVGSRPEGADVFDANGALVGTTPTALIESQVGERVSFRVEKDGFEPALLQAEVPASAAEEPLLLEAELKIFSPPQPSEPWIDHLGQQYRPMGEGHETVRSVGQSEWERYREAKQRPADAAEFLELDEGGSKRRLALTSAVEAQEFCGWLATTGLETGYLTESHEALPVMDSGFDSPALSERARREGLKPFRCQVRPIPFGRIVVSSEPAGAEVFVKAADASFNNSVGRTNGPLAIEALRPGAVELLVLLEGYKPLSREVVLKPGETLELGLKLELNHSVVMDRPWENGLGMKFVPLGKDLMASVWETRVRDYDAFVRGSGRHLLPATDFQQGPDHPVVFVSRKDGEDFCVWLTEVERQQERLSQVHEYRLPTDYEWSLMVGLEELPDVSPAKREPLKSAIFPWGDAWPPGADGAKVGNLADAATARLPGISSTRVIEDYQDGFESTAPVGSFPANALGLHDLCGNVHEWVSDNYSPISSSGVLRGGGWNTYQAQNLYLGARNTQPPDFRDSIYGFRVVLAKVPPKAEAEEDQPEEQDHGGD
ncbi:MAG: PEGA domain-containing protein [Verrucomicrobia bacterium]|nr:MAG: PEGA domain-containing protein [Verrucomicrobiota bacterium]TAE89122.1 MAG: PEGA domain-containing protein [Verrucomicrobiota bacterium]TAF28004.1 MAG: PEGA domain-containing protein [Verrucomicrobiota bacterium]TAF42851.1 MAG: PEGA domain-containing protein [Verrucomicrobiota bacterium]